MKPKTYLFPRTVNRFRADKAITPKVRVKACRGAGIIRAYAGTEDAKHALAAARVTQVRIHRALEV
jgi:hypothetical protein